MNDLARDDLARDGRCSGTLIARLDVAARLIRITGTGTWTIALLERHIGELQRLLAKARAHGGGVRVLSDLSRADVQAPDVASRIEQLTVEAYGPEDRIAVVVASSLLRIQMRRVVQQARLQTFPSAAAAEAWLKTHDDAAAPARTPTIARAPRRTTSIVTTLHGGGRTLAVRILNISSSGLLIDGRDDLGVGERLRITLPVIGAVPGRIVRVRQALAGIRLDHPIAVESLRQS